MCLWHIHSVQYSPFRWFSTALQNNQHNSKTFGIIIFCIIYNRLETRTQTDTLQSSAYKFDLLNFPIMQKNRKSTTNLFG